VIWAVLLLIVLAVLAAAASLVWGEPGHATLEWLGWRLDMTAAAAVMLVVLGALVVTGFWRAVIWMVQAPGRAARRAAMTRRRQGGEALTRGFLAVAAGDGGEARRWAVKAADLVDDSPAMVRVLAAEAALAAGDETAARAAYSAMLSFPDMTLAGRRGLMQLALARGDRAEAIANAEAGYAMGRTARWAWEALFEARLEAGDWPGALELVKSAQERKIATRPAAERARTALLAALAADLEASPEAATRSQALGHAVDAAKLEPGFSPAAAIAARLLAAEDKTGRAAHVIQAAWKAEPHPALFLAWRDLHTRETPAERAGRLRSLAELNPEHRESRFVMIELALVTGDAPAARLAAAPLLLEPPTQRFCALMARTALAAADADEARAWVARATAAPPEPDWTDIGPDGHAFPYGRRDWARVIEAWGERGELVHPRLERGDPVIDELPALPSGYRASAAFLRAAEAGPLAAPLPDDPGPIADVEPATAPAEAPPPGPRARPRRARSPRRTK
jgi:HemY protein